MIETTSKEMSKVTWLTLASVEMNYDDKQKKNWKKKNKKIENKRFIALLY
jgi:hypothetical protein